MEKIQDEYIGKNDAIEVLKAYFSDEKRTETEYGAYWHHVHVIRCIEQIIPADVELVVHCRDCDSWNEDDTYGHETLGNLVCSCSVWSTEETATKKFTGPDEYCSRGERKEPDGN